MTFDVSRLADPLFVSENRERPHSDHRWFRSAAEAAAGSSSFEQSLNGLWKFHYASSFDESPAGFEAPDFDASGWDEIPVPGHIQMHGYDRPQYVNVQYPWDGHEQIMPGQIPTQFNPVASYLTTFEMSDPLHVGERLGIVFHGAESGLAVWLNGHYVGYGSDSFTPNEFDLTSFVSEGRNVLAVQVFKWTSQSWLEDQDFYRFSGIFRDVVLVCKPSVHAADLLIKTTLSDDFSGAEVSVVVSLEGDGSVRAHLGDGTKLLQLDDDTYAAWVTSPRLWSSEDPHLYDLTVEVLDRDGQVIEVIPQKVGIRKFALDDGVFKINGQRIVFKGVNRHDFGLNGRVVTRAEAEQDVLALKRLGLNAVRTSHYPNNTFFYELCDQYGLYVIDEMNLETHGMWDRIRFAGAPDSESVPGDKPEWTLALMDRAANMLERDKNHASIVMWSCGNESYGGRNILAVADYFRRVDDRPVHYEGVAWDPRYPETTDVRSEMYTPADRVEEYLKEHRDKPMILCEFAHAMGNSFGAVDKYIDLAYREPLFQGGFIWDFADQAIKMTDRYGAEFFGYGGDNLEAPHDSDFCGNGIMFADHTPKPFTQEVKYVYQGVMTRVTEGGLEVENRMLFTNTSTLDAVVTLAREDHVLARETISVEATPLSSGHADLPFALPTEPGEYTVTVSWRDPETRPWAPAGHEVATDQGVFTVGSGKRQSDHGSAPQVVLGIHNIGVRGDSFEVLFSRLSGGLVSYRFGGATPEHELLRGKPMPNFWHAPTSNERGWKSASLDGQWLLASRYAVAQQGADQPVFEALDDSARITFTYTLPTSEPSQCEVSYRVFGDGEVEVSMRVDPGVGLSDLPECGFLFPLDAQLRHLRWYGEGPMESYVDRRGGAQVGVYSADVRDQLTKYLRPQEAGNHTGVRWAEVTDDNGVGMVFSHSTQMELSALPWTPFEIENAEHHTELPPIHRTIVRPALMRRGVGGDDTWGARTHPEYLVPNQSLSFTFSFRGVTGK